MRVQAKNSDWDTSCEAVAMAQVRDGGGLDILKVGSEGVLLKGQLLS